MTPSVIRTDEACGHVEFVQITTEKSLAENLIGRRSVYRTRNKLN
jgi:hypothetical protein